MILKVPGKKMIIRFNNNSGSLENTIKFLENIQKKVNFIDLTVDVERNDIKIILHGTRDLQYLAREKLEDLARQFF